MKKKKFTASDIKADATIGVFGHYGRWNLGDESIIAGVIQNIAKRLPKARIVCFSRNPLDTSNRYNVEAYPVRRDSNASRPIEQPLGARDDTTCPEGNEKQDTRNHGGLRSFLNGVKAFVKRSRFGAMLVSTAGKVVRSVPTFFEELRFLKKSYRILGDIDLLMITGSNQFLDNFGGPWGYPYTLLKWSTMARLSGTHLIYVSVGAGPVESKLSMLMFRWAVKHSEYTSLRDGPSEDLIRAMGVRQETSVYPDLAYSVYTSQDLSKDARLQSRGAKPTVGINPMPVYDRRYWYLADDQRYARYVKNLAKFAAILLSEDYPLVFWGTHPQDQNVISDVLTRVESELKRKSDSMHMTATANTVDELIALIRSFDLVVPTRFHGTLLSLSAGKPVLSICYHRKSADLMMEMGQSEYSVSLDTMDFENLLIRFKNLEHNMREEIDKIRSKSDEYRKDLTKQYDRLFGPPSF